MTPKERAAMQQALEALEVYGEHAKDCPQYPTYTRPQDYPKCDCGFEEAIAALREALAERKVLTMTQEEMVDAIRSAKIEQAEQEPVAFKVYRGEVCYKSKEDDQSYGMWCPVVPDYRAPFPEGNKFYAAPVRTKDLTDGEIHEAIINFKQDPKTYDGLGNYRAVIAADREKNK